MNETLHFVFVEPEVNGRGRPAPAKPGRGRGWFDRHPLFSSALCFVGLPLLLLLGLGAVCLPISFFI